ncbi:MAG: sulfur oxidation c-type cytochrome SoxX [Betaproteobacteria bacterium]|nr:sulfur oxidation c-type cytochrome SoxX [Betaproteobacteria bacterium]
MHTTLTITLGLAAAAATPLTCAEPSDQQTLGVLQRDFHARGQATMDRVVQDGLQRICTLSGDQPPAEVAKALEADQMRTIVFPSGSLMGEWKRGEAIAQSGRGSMWNDQTGAAAGGSCYNCHQLSPQEQSHGTLAPSLLGFGNKRGNGPQVQQYVYGKIYNAKAYNLCSQMPRLGHAGTLTEQQIKDLVALLLDPASPVNK